MNPKRRKQLSILAKRVADIVSDLESLRDDEQADFDDLSERQQDGERGQAIRDNLSDIEDALDNLDPVYNTLIGIAER
jgi:hypothetical protein